MIFVTVGGQLPFDRLVGLVDAWAERTGRPDVFAQIGPGGHPPRHLAWQELLTPAECRQRMLEAEAIVGHAGMGTILTALDLGRPLVVMPRLARHGEHRNDHQIGTARCFAESGEVRVAFDEGELHDALDHLKELPVPRAGGHRPAPGLLDRIRRFALEDA